MLLKNAKPAIKHERHCLACGEELNTKSRMLICTDCLDLKCAAFMEFSEQISDSTNIAESLHGRIRT